jgi:transcriptional regulator with XRE-family HTH domain
VLNAKIDARYGAVAWQETRGAGKLAVMPGTATAHSQRFGLALTTLRRVAGIKQVDASRHVGASDGSLLSRWEKGVRIPDADDVLTLCDLYGATPEHAEFLVHLAEQARTPGWWDREDVPCWFARYLASEDTADEVWTYDQLIPGLLQTREYTDALCDSCSAAAPSDNGDALVVVRSRRQLRLAGRNPLRLRAVVYEVAFREPMGGRTVMRDQIAHLRAVAQRPNISLQVMPFGMGDHPGHTGPFALLRFPEPSMNLVFTERRGAATYETDPKAVERHAADFEVISKVALSELDSITWLETAEQELS